MKVGIITIHNHCNYGAVLQAYALNKAVRNLGHKCKTIDCNLEPDHGRGLIWTKRPGKFITSLYLACHLKDNGLFYERFQNFIDEFIPLTSTKYYTYEELNKDCPSFDVYITGSDQVWRPSLLDRPIGKAFHLCFAPHDKARLISYAPSFGINNIPASYKQEITRYLLGYDSLSIREERGKEIIYELTGKNATQVLDPTLLLSQSDYEEIEIVPNISDDYLLVYPMELGKKQQFFNMVKILKKNTSLSVVCIFQVGFDWRWLTIADHVVLNAGPREFLGYFKKASMICTNSFHGTVFSILYGKNFLGSPHTVSNSRIYSLLQLSGLNERQITMQDVDKILGTMNTPINYNKVTPRLKKNIRFSLDYLQQAIEGGKIINAQH